MSAIARSYKIDKVQLPQGLAILERKEYKEFWKFMETFEVATLPYSGYVLAAVIPFMRTKGIRLPNAGNGALLSDAQRKQLGVVACGNATEYQSAGDDIAGLQTSDAELQKYYAELYEHDWDEAATAMHQGFAFILQGIRSLNSEDELLIFSIL
jgi:hypothetical protein